MPYISRLTYWNSKQVFLTSQIGIYWKLGFPTQSNEHKRQIHYYWTWLISATGTLKNVLQFNLAQLLSHTVCSLIILAQSSLIPWCIDFVKNQNIYAHQGPTFRLMFSNLELTQDHVLQAPMLWFFNCHNKCCRIECFESCGWRIKCFES